MPTGPRFPSRPPTSLVKNAEVISRQRSIISLREGFGVGDSTMRGKEKGFLKSGEAF